MADNVEFSILRVLQQLQGETASQEFVNVDQIVGRAKLPRWVVAEHATRLAVDGYVHPDPQRTVIPQYRLAPRGHARLMRTRSGSDAVDRLEEKSEPALHQPLVGSEFTKEALMVRQHVLVVDDDRTIRSFVRQALSMENYEVETASNGIEALEAIDQRRPAVMLLDMQMPYLDGRQVAHCLRERDRWLPTVVMTGAADAPHCCAELMADACLGKPFGLDDLLGSVTQALSK
jgi:CheY-like chemotaxis protein